MAASNYIQSSFLGGAWSQTMQGRVDRPDYRTAMSVCLNGLPIEQGAWTRRPCFKFAATTRNGNPGRTIPYAIRQNAPYTMELTDGYLRFFNGLSLATTNDPHTVSSISSASPAVALTADAHGWSTNDVVYWPDATEPLLKNRQFVIAVIDTTHFHFGDPITGDLFDGTALGSYTATAAVRVQQLVAPYTGGSWSTVRAIQADTNAILLHSFFKPQVVSVSVDPTPSSDAEFEIAPATFEDGPYLDPPTNGAQLVPSATGGIVGLTIAFPAWQGARAYSIGDVVTSASNTYRSIKDQNFNKLPSIWIGVYWESVSPGVAVGPNGFLSTDLDRHVRLCSEPALWSIGATYTPGDSVTYGDQTYWTSLTAGNTGNVPGVDIVNWKVNPTGSVWTWGKIVGFRNEIPGNLSGSAYFGNMTGGGGIVAAFNGIADQVAANSASLSTGSLVTPGSFDFVQGWVGKNFGGTAAGQYAIASATIYPPTDLPFAYRIIQPYPPSGAATATCTIDLRASNTPPSVPGDGFSLGSYTFPAEPSSLNPGFGVGAVPVTIISAAPTTPFTFVWVAITVASSNTSAVGESIYTYAFIGQVKMFTSSVGITDGIDVEISGPDLLSTAAIRTWRLGMYDATNWPTCGTYHEGRLWLSGPVKNRIVGSMPNQDFTNAISFAPTKPDGTVADDNAIDYTFTAPDVNSILWMKPDQQGIICGTEKGEWLVQATSINQPLTPTSIQAHQVTHIGSSYGDAADAVKTDHTIAFIQRHNQKVMEYFPDVFSGKFAAPNLAMTAPHLTSRGIEELAYQQSLSPVIWARCADGSLLGCSYKRDSLVSSQGPSFAGWHQHVHGGERLFTSVAVGPSSDGTLDTLTVVTSTSTGGSPYHVEILSNIFQETDVATNAFFLDNAVVPSVTQNVLHNGNLTMRCTGLWHLEGQTVTVFAGGLDCGDWPVSGGQLHVVYGRDPAALFTSAFALNFDNFPAAFPNGIPVLVGFTYTSDGQIVRPDTQQESGSRTGPGFGKMRRTQEFAALLSNTQGISFGTTFDLDGAGRTQLNLANFTTPGGTAYAANALYSGIWWGSLNDAYSRDNSRICWRITRPYPATIAAISGYLQTQE